ncbi:NKAP family protein CG6066 [Amyelois transitella]|uniref:NKAP family protein CG6066 n=1 Tax=Amyelois transitella TaxID=680683 RepID=UPI00298F486F|nr:NKAP family protein CG6066 [Amyelois transitella]XP_013193188.2 NKAP family protein CG6066 [Amyelois transitella]XP_060810430.1 NKAP family protein CG6066 [Amyelois transitella]
MLSDESSSDSETGRFKGRSTNQDEQKRSSNQKEDSSRFPGRSRPTENDKFRRDFERQKDNRDRFRQDRDRYRYSRHSPISKRRYSRERNSPRPREHYRHGRDTRERPKPIEHRGSSRDRQKRSRSRSYKPLERSRDIKEEIRRSLAPNDTKDSHLIREKDRSRDKEPVKKEKSLSPDLRAKRSEVHRPSPVPPRKRKSESPIVIEHSDESDEVKPGSYYSMIPAIVKEKSEESSEIDSSDDEKLRAKLLNLEKELHKTRKKKHKKKSKKKSSKSSSHDKEQESATVEVSSTTDIQDNIRKDEQKTNSEVAEVSSTQKSSQKESCEEGEISSDDDSNLEYDPTDLRYKLKRSAPKRDLSAEKANVCGPALPPHLQKRFAGSSSSDVEGPALPPHLSGSRNLGPSIPDDMRKVLANTKQADLKYESSDEDIGIGPLPTGAEEKWSDAHKKLEERALDMKIRKLEGHSLKSDQVKSREQWMLELPEGKAKYLGLEARSFRAKEGPDMSDRSSWTDTPEEKARKAAGIAKEEDAELTLQREAKARQISSRDEQQELAVKKHKKKHKRDESLLDMHQKKLKKKKKKEEKEEGKKERRPFSRDVDLQVNRFDDAQKKSIIKKAQELDTRFSRGEAKFL